MNNPIITYKGRNYTAEELLERLDAGEKLLHRIMEQYRAECCSTSTHSLNEQQFENAVNGGLLFTFKECKEFLTHDGISPTFNLF